MTDETLIGQYRILRTLGAGGMGTVYLAEHLLLGRRAAIKTLLPSLSSHREIVERFFNEARAISAISDPGVVQIFDFGYHVDGTAYIVMEFLEGESLASRLDRMHKLPLAEALRISRQIAVSLGEAHARGIVHRDLKPGNVFIIRDSEAQGGERTKILDFGICKLSGWGEPKTTSTQTGTMLGTPVYMSPEQCRGAGSVDHRSDLYSVGCALFHMLTGRPPFDCESVGEFIAAHLKEEPPAPSELEPSLPPAVDALVLRCIAKSPDDRFQSMTDLKIAIEEVLATLSDPGRFATPVEMSETPLAEGFKSSYDVNHREVPTVSQTPRPRARVSNPWFVDSLAPGSASAVGDDQGWAAPERRMSFVQRAALTLALFAGLLAGVAATSTLIAGGYDEPVDAPSVVAAPSPEPLSPATATTRELLPTESIAQTGDEVAPELGTDEPAKMPGAAQQEVPATFTQDAPVVKKKPERPRPVRRWYPRPRRHVAPAQAEQAEEAEEAEEATPTTEDDLYDTR